MELKKGEYVRTTSGIITRVSVKIGDEYAFEDMKDSLKILRSLKSHCFSIIGVLEIGDFVNGEIVSKVDEQYLLNLRLGGVFTSNNDVYYYPEEIKTVLTHEQYDKVVYKLNKEEN